MILLPFVPIPATIAPFFSHQFLNSQQHENGQEVEAQVWAERHPRQVDQAEAPLFFTP